MEIIQYANIVLVSDRIRNENVENTIMSEISNGNYYCPDYRAYFALFHSAVSDYFENTIIQESQCMGLWSHFSYRCSLSSSSSSRYFFPIFPEKRHKEMVISLILLLERNYPVKKSIRKNRSLVALVEWQLRFSDFPTGQNGQCNML